MFRKHLARWLSVSAVAVMVMALAAPSGAAVGDWPQFHHDNSHSGTQPDEAIIGVSNVATLATAWTAPATGAYQSSPAVVDGVVYVGATGLLAYDAAGVTNCSGSPTVCSPLWTGPTGDSIYASPAVDDGAVYVADNDTNLYAFDAAGVTNCSGSPTTCSPLWTGTAGGSLVSSPAVD